MPFLEFLLFTIVAIIIVVYGALGLYFGTLAALILLIINFFIGWIPILTCVSDPDWDISFSGNFVEAWAALSLLIYVVSGIGLLILKLTISNRGELPPGLQLLAFLFPHPAEPHVREAITTGKPVDGPAMAFAMRSKKPATRTGEQIRAHNARKVAKDAEAEAERRKAEQELADATVEMERARVRLEEARKRAAK